jgi:hypothetical protein
MCGYEGLIEAGLKFLGGTVAIVGDGVAAVAFPPTLASMIGGATVLGDAMTD